jgi:hypothetical protein
MKSKTMFIPIVVSVLVMLSFMFIIDSSPERHIALKESERKADTVSIRTNVIDSLFSQFSLLNNLQVLKDDSDDELFKVTVKNLNSPNDLLSKDWKSSGLLEASLKKEGFQVEVSEQRPYDVTIRMKQKDGFVVIPAGVLFTLLYPKK